MRNKVFVTLAILMGIVLSTSFLNYFAYDSSYDSAQGISSSSHRAEQQSQGGINYQNLNSPAEDARSSAGMGFDSQRDSNTGWGNQYIPTPTPKIERQ